ncbi:MAG: sulfur carrier protein ThiS [Clostridiales bacterium]|nr:sulfur carrier protein ThiS [Clostridiales bacterium]
MIINGKNYLYDEMSITHLLNALEIKEKMIVVEINNRIIEQKLYDEQMLKKDDKIEIVSFVGGG